MALGLADGLFFLVALGCPAAVIVGMLGPVQGGGMKLDTAFTWHPILMSIAFSCFMVLGRWAYVTDSLGDKAKQRPVHRALMVLAALFAIGGYVAIFLAHRKIPSFFGYNFKTHKWGEPIRVAHDFLGYAVLLLTFSQATMGFFKLSQLKAGHKIFTFHGSLGKVILLLAAVQVVVASITWKWSQNYRLLVSALAILASLAGAFWPYMRQEESARLASA